MKPILYPHQKEAVEKLRSGSILCGGVGSGKTIASLAFFFNKIICGDVDKGIKPTKSKNLFIITTAHKRDSMEWSEDMAKLSLCLGENKYNNGVCFTVVVDSWNNIEKYEYETDSFFIFDEQRVVGYGSWSKAFIKIAKTNKWILLSATPGDCWMDYVPVFVANGFYKGKTDFCMKHVVWNRFTKFAKVDRYVDTGVLYKYRNQILIPMPCERKTRQNHFYKEMSYNKDIINYILKERKDPITKKPFKDVSQLCLAMRVVTNASEDRAKAIVDLVKQKKKVIVFYNFTFEASKIKQELASNYICYAEWNGQAHQPIPDTESWCYIVQYTAGCEGWNCIETDTIIFYSESYSYKQMCQAAGRIDRINTPHTELYYYHFTSDSPIDKAIRRSLQNKKNFNEKSFITL